MDTGKSGLPSYKEAVRDPHRGRRGPGLGMRRRRVVRLLGLACFVLIAAAQWRLAWRPAHPRLSRPRLADDLAACRALRQRPQDPEGTGRVGSARHVAGVAPTLIRNALVWVGEPDPGTPAADARAGHGWRWVRADVLLERGLITRVDDGIADAALPAGAHVFDARGRQLTSGIIDMHSHAGVDALPELAATADYNEMSDNVTPWARSLDGLDVLDPQIQVIKSGGVTASLVLPGSSNNVGGEAFVVKLAVGAPGGRNETSACDMLAAPEPGGWRYLKMACGENPKNVYGGIGRAPFSRMGESYAFRRALDRARDLVRRQDDWCELAEGGGVDAVTDYLPRDLTWEALAAVMRGQVQVHTHCYTIADLETMVDHSNEFGFAIRAFHHAYQAYLVPEAGLSPSCSWLPSTAELTARPCGVPGAVAHRRPPSSPTTCTTWPRPTSAPSTRASTCTTRA